MNYAGADEGVDAAVMRRNVKQGMPSSMLSTKRH